jgi:hypothetical protein
MSRSRPFTEAVKAACKAEGLDLLPFTIARNPSADGADGVVLSLRLSVTVEGRDIAGDDTQAARGAIRAMRARAAKAFKLEDGRQRVLPGM